MLAANDNHPPRSRMIPLIGVVSHDGRVRLSLIPRLIQRLFPNDHRQA